MPHQSDRKLKKNENKELKILQRRSKNSLGMIMNTDLEQGCVTDVGSSQYRHNDGKASDIRIV